MVVVHLVHPTSNELNYLDCTHAYYSIYFSIYLNKSELMLKEKLLITFPLSMLETFVPLVFFSVSSLQVRDGILDFHLSMTSPRRFQRNLELFLYALIHPQHVFKLFWIFSYNQLFSFLSYKTFEEFGTFLHILIFPSIPESRFGPLCETFESQSHQPPTNLETK